MAQFQLITSTREYMFPHEKDLHERLEIRTKCESEGMRLFCACNELNEYKIRDRNGAVYPVEQGAQGRHEDWCPKSSIYKTNRGYNGGFEVDDETGLVKVILSEPLKRGAEAGVGNVIVQIPRNGGERRYPGYQQGQITVSAMIKKLNMLTFRHVAYYTNKESENYLYPSVKGMVQKIFWAQNRTKIGRKQKSIAELTIQNDNTQFIYEELLDIETAKSKKNPRLVSKRKITDDTYYSVPVHLEELDRALEEYQDTYNTDNMSNRNIVFSGFRDKYGLFSLHFILVNDYGLFSESMYEVKMYNAICQIMNEYKLKEKGVHFYKPFEYGYGAYEDQYLEDGIIEFDGSKRKIIIEVYGRKDEDYLRKKEIKERILSSQNNIYDYIPWNAYENESLPITTIEKSIWAVLEKTHARNIID